MKKWWLVLALCILLYGCGTKETFETVDDADAQPVVQQKKEILLTVEEDAVILESDTGVMYLCDGYEVSAQIVSAGNLSGTLRDLTGFGAESMTVIETAASGMDRYEGVWTSAGEGGDMVGRVVVIDDGVWHYCVTISCPAEDAPALQQTWQKILSSVAIL